MTTDAMNLDPQRFWELYKEGGAKAAIDYALEFAARGDEGYDELLAEHVPALIKHAKDMEIDMITFLGDLDQLESDQLAEKEDAIRADNDASELRTDSGSEAGLDEDADVSTETRAADGEDRGEDEGSTSS